MQLAHVRFEPDALACVKALDVAGYDLRLVPASTGAYVVTLYTRAEPTLGVEAIKGMPHAERFLDLQLIEPAEDGGWLIVFPHLMGRAESIH